MKDDVTTVAALEDAVLALCRRKGWGRNGIQNPQHVLMAMTVEVLELTEHFIGLTAEGERALRAGERPGELTEIAEETADVMMYSLQALFTLSQSVSQRFGGDMSDETTPLSTLRESLPLPEGDCRDQALRVGAAARFALEEVQWLDDTQTARLQSGELPEKARAVGDALCGMYRELFGLSRLLNMDLSGAIERKIAIVDGRVYPKDDPVR